MYDYLDLGPVPYDESCQQIGTATYDPIRAKAECVAYRNQLRRMFGPEPQGASLRVKSNPHDFGSYYSLQCRYEEVGYQHAFEYALKCETKGPAEWDDEARKELNLL